MTEERKSVFQFMAEQSYISPNGKTLHIGKGKIISVPMDSEYIVTDVYDMETGRLIEENKEHGLLLPGCMFEGYTMANPEEVKRVKEGKLVPQVQDN